MNLKALSAVLSIGMLLCIQSANATEIVLDKRNASSATDYRVKICARNSPGNREFPGHCYLVWSKKVGSNPAVEEMYGFYPDPNGVPLLNNFYSSTGALKAEDPSLTNPSDCTVTVIVSQTAYDQSIQKRDSFKTQSFILGLKDCVTVCNEIAKSLGLNHLDGTAATRPKTFVHELYELNANPPAPVHP